MQTAAAETIPVAAPPAVPIALAPKPRKAHPSKFKEAASARNVWHHVLDQNTKYDDLLTPEYWAHVAKTLRPGDKIEVIAEDSSFWAELFVLATANQAAAVVEIRKVALQSVELPDAQAGVKVEWKGPNLKWCVYRTKDNERIQSGIDTRMAAQTAAGEYMRTVSR